MTFWVKSYFFVFITTRRWRWIRKWSEPQFTLVEIPFVQFGWFKL